MGFVLTIFNHAQAGHGTVRARKTSRKKPRLRKLDSRRKPSWYSSLGLGPQFNPQPPRRKQ